MTHLVDSQELKRDKYQYSTPCPVLSSHACGMVVKKKGGPCFFPSVVQVEVVVCGALCFCVCIVLINYMCCVLRCTFTSDVCVWHT